jgi:hypothetical protein
MIILTIPYNKQTKKILTEHDCHASWMYLYNDNCTIKGLENYEDHLSHKLRG